MLRSKISKAKKGAACVLPGFTVLVLDIRSRNPSMTHAMARAAASRKWKMLSNAGCMALLRKQLSTSSIRSSRTTNIHYPKHSSLPPGSITEFVWKDYCPTIFRNIQVLGNVSNEDYMQSVCNHETLMELAFRGCCGKPFYVSHDDRFVIKTLRKSEAKVLIEILPNYCSHLQKHENSLLAKYYGLHASRPGTGGAKVYFVVMENLLQTEMQLQKRYDLKGSSQGRAATKNGAQPRLTLKDLEFDLCFYLNNSLRKQILEQIKLDCKFLEETGIMDYSLLLGIHVEHPRRGSKRRSPDDSIHEDSVNVQGTNQNPDGIVESFHKRDPTFSHFTTDDYRVNVIRFGAKVPARARKNNIVESENQESPSESKKSKTQAESLYNVYLFMGIIDFLQNYNMIKRLEHAYKSLHYNSKTISSVNPKLYASRFQEYLSRVFLDEEEEEEEEDDSAAPKAEPEGFVHQNTT